MRLPFLLTSLGMSGCIFDTIAKEDGPYGPTCVDDSAEIALDDSSALGFSANDMLALAGGERTDSFVYASDGHSTPLTINVSTVATTARLVISTTVWPEDTGGEEPMYSPEMDTASSGDDAWCPDHIEIDASVDFATEDGAFDEHWSVELYGSGAGITSFGLALDPHGLGGSYDMEAALEGEDYDSLDLSAYAVFDADGSWGAIDGDATGQDDCEDGETCTAWDMLVEVGDWGTPR